MSVNFRPPNPEMLDVVMGVIINLHDAGVWKTETWKDYDAPIVRRGAGGDREGLLASYGLVPRKRIPPGVRRFDTVNARWRTALGCRRVEAAALGPASMTGFHKLDYENGKLVRCGKSGSGDSIFTFELGR